MVDRQHPLKSFFANCVLVLFITVGLATFWHGLTLGSGQIVWRIIVLVGSGIGIFAVAAILFLDAEVRTNTALVLLSVAVSAFAAEFIIAARSGYDWRDRLQVLKDLRDEGVEAYPSIAPGEYVRDSFEAAAKAPILPLGGISNVLTVACKEAGAWSTYRSDRYGFNNDDAAYDGSNISVLIIGDSFAASACVQQGEGVASRLRQQSFNAISVGALSNGPLLELASLKEYGPSLTPSFVLWLYFDGNDLTDLSRSSRVPMLGQYLSEGFSQDLISRQSEIDRFWSNLIVTDEKWLLYIAGTGIVNSLSRFYLDNQNLIKLKHLRNAAGLVGASFIDRNPPMADLNILPVFEKIILEMKRETQVLGARLVFVYLPGQPNYVGNPSPTRRIVLELVAKQNIEIVDFGAAIMESGDPLGLYADRMNLHYTAEGYRLLADTLVAQVLAKQP